MSDTLLAKSPRDPTRIVGAETLRGHTLLVLRAADELLRLRALASARAAGIPGHVDRLRRVVRLAAFVHDLGKANDHFQAMVRGQRRAPQLIKHEALSLWLSWPGQQLAGWLRSAVETDRDYMLAILAAAGHHRRFAASALAPVDSGAGTRLTLLIGGTQFTELLRAGAGEFELGAAPVLADRTLEVSRRWSPVADFDRWEREASEQLRVDRSERRLLAIAKALVLDADVAGSALPRAGEKPAWIATQLATRADRGRIESVVTTRLGGHPLRPFQEDVARSSAPITLVRAGCGSGKTAAAYLWAARQHVGRQLWVTYPTTGTATEGFRDYLVGADIEGRLEHSRAEVDIDILGLAEGGLGRDRDRLDAIRGWGCEAITCTVDTVLGLVQNQRKGLYAWAGLAESAIVFDEIHAYDDALFGALVRFLRDLPGIPALLMTASLPSERLELLARLTNEVHERDLVVIDGPAELEALPRYVRSHVADPWQAVEACMADGGKVLWVQNTVDRCRGRAVESGGRALVYHSRFRYSDRVERHRDVIATFGASGAALAVTTQVAEMSLDLSADLLVTDLAPVPALIQRLGRLNRRATPAATVDAKPFVVLPFNGLPYDDSSLQASERWLGELGTGPLSQRDLVQAWRPEPALIDADPPSSWLDGGFHTTATAVREESYGITVIMEADAADVRDDPREAVARALPMGPPPRTLQWRSWPRVRGYPVAPASSIDYDRLRGAAWEA